MYSNASAHTTCFTSVCFTRFFFLNVCCQITPLLNVRFLIFDLTSTAHFLWEYHSSFTPFLCMHTFFIGMQLGRKTSAGCDVTQDRYFRIVTSSIYKCHE